MYPNDNNVLVAGQYGEANGPRGNMQRLQLTNLAQIKQLCVFSRLVRRYVQCLLKALVQALGQSACSSKYRIQYIYIYIIWTAQQRQHYWNHAVQVTYFEDLLLSLEQFNALYPLPLPYLIAVCVTGFLGHHFLFLRHFRKRVSYVSCCIDGCASNVSLRLQSTLDVFSFNPATKGIPAWSGNLGPRLRMSWTPARRRRWQWRRWGLLRACWWPVVHAGKVH